MNRFISKSYSIKKGSGCSINGSKYELHVHSILSNCKLGSNAFNTQKQSELGGCSSKNDIQCNLHSEKDVSIEIKKMMTPDWMQCALKYDHQLNKWMCSKNNKIPEGAKLIFENLVSGLSIFNGKLPPYISRNITHEEWKHIKRTSADFNDAYFDCPPDTIKSLYFEKNCSYIQISEKGLYHTGVDPCGFGVPEFICPQQLRIRTKIHSKKNAKGFCNLSTTVSCKPVDIRTLPPSKYSLDAVARIPAVLTWSAGGR